MEKVNVTFGGMTMCPDDAVAKDGDMAILLNARSKNGEIVPRTMPEEEKVSYKVKKAVYHACSDMLLELDGDGVLRKNGAPFYEEAVTAVNFETMGNMVVVYLEKDVTYSVWRNDRYEHLGGLPTLPQWSVMNFNDTNSKFSYEVNGTYSDNVDYENYYWKVQKGLMDKALSYIYDQKGYVDRAWFRLGVRLFDGTYICLSDILELSNFEPVAYPDASMVINKKILGAQVREYANGSAFVVKLYYFIPQFWVQAMDTPWKDLIAGIDILSTGSIMSQKPGMLDEADMEYPIPGVEIYKWRTPQELKNALMDAEFYRVATYDTEGKMTWSIDNTSPSNFAVQERLEGSLVHKVIPKSTEVYNARLHAYDYKELLFEGYGSMTTYYGGGTQHENGWDIYVYIKTDEGIKVVYKEERPVFYNIGSATQYIYKHSYVFSYPDSRAFKAVVFKDGERREFKLTAHPRRNEAYFIETRAVDVQFKETILNTPNQNIFLYDVPVVINVFSGWESAMSEPSVDDVVNKKDVLKVGEVDNAMYFPTEMTYSFDSNIKGVASVAEAVSQGQFGEFPLYVFTEMEVFAMHMDATGKTAYTGQSVVSRERCTGDVCATSRGVAFVTPKGVMLLAGSEAMDLSAVLDGFEGERVRLGFALVMDGREWEVIPKVGSPVGNYIRTEDNEQLWIQDDNYNGIELTDNLDGKTVSVRFTSSGEVVDAVVKMRFVYAFERDALMNSIFGRASLTAEGFAPVPIRVYLDGAKMAYNYVENELIVSNNKFGYSYVLGLANGAWNVMNIVFDVAAQKTVGMILYDNIRKTKLILKDGYKAHVVAITRPIKTDTLDYKRLRQAALRCTFKGTLNFYVLGSNDGVNFVCITGKEYPSKNGREPTDVMRRDLVTAMSRSRQYRYFALAFAGDFEGRVSFAELLVDTGFSGNKLR